MPFTANKYLKKSFHFDIIYRPYFLKNPLELSYTKKSYFFSPKNSIDSVGDASIIKSIASCFHGKTKTILLSFRPINELYIKKNDVLFSLLGLNKSSAQLFIYLFSLNLSPNFVPLSLDLKKNKTSLYLDDIPTFFPYNYYSSCFSVQKNQVGSKKKFSFSFSSSFYSDSICLISTFLPFFGHAKRVNSFRSIQCEVEQSGSAR
jgi:hypothetical protein